MDGTGGSCGGTLNEGAQQKVLLSERTLGDLRMGWAMADAWRGTSLSNFRLMNISCTCRIPSPNPTLNPTLTLSSKSFYVPVPLTPSGRR